MVCNNPGCSTRGFGVDVSDKVTECIACHKPLTNPYDEFYRDDSIPVDADLSTVFGNLWRSGSGKSGGKL